MKCPGPAGLALLWQLSLSAQAVSRQTSASPFLTYEDTSVTEPGGFSISQYASFDKSPSSKSLSAPGIDFSLGLTRRLELSGFGAASFLRDGEPSASGADDGYLGVKYLFWDEGAYRPGFATRPMLQLLASPNESGRVHFLLPVILEKDVKLCKLAYTLGYLTAGAVYSSAKCEWNSDGRVTPVAVLSASRVTKHWNELREEGLNRTQFYGSAGINFNLNERWSIFVEAGRTVGRQDENSSRYGFTASLAYTGFLWGRDRNAQSASPSPRTK